MFIKLGDQFDLLPMSFLSLHDKENLDAKGFPFLDQKQTLTKNVFSIVFFRLEEQHMVSSGKSVSVVKKYV